ncbi:MAG: hypothetical protein AB8C84_10460, partial [Oligoflexales bacterium]
KGKDEAGNTSSCVNDTIIHDDNVPTSTSIVIDGGTHTSDGTPDLTLAATGASEMYITNTSGCSANGTWESYTTSKAGWTLGQSDSTATVYAKFKDEAGNTSSCVNDTIIHDDNAPTSASLIISSGATTTISATVGLSPSAVSASEMYVTNTSGCNSGGSWESYATTKTGWPLAQTNATATVYVKFRDQALNMTSCVSDTILHDNTGPTTPGSFSDGVTTDDMTASPIFSWSASSDAGSGLSHYEIALGTSSGATNTQSWTSVGSSVSTTLSGLSLSNGTTYYATIRSVDTAGNTSASVYGDGFVAKRSVKTLSAGRGHSVCAVLSNDQLKCWGDNGYGELGYGNTDNIGDDSGEMGDRLSAVDLGTGRTALSVAVGKLHTCALLDNNQAKCWGYGLHGSLGQGNGNSLGDGSGEMGDSLSAIDLGAGRTVQSLAGAEFHTCALLDNNQVKCWGAGSFGKLGNGSSSNVGDGSGEMGDDLDEVELGSGLSVLSIDAGYLHTCVVLSNNTLKCWGSGISGMLGNGSQDNIGDSGGEMGNSLSAVDLGTGRTALSVSAGGRHTCAVLDNNQLKCWGANYSGQLGYGNTDNLGDSGGEMGDSLSAVDLGTGRTALSVSAGNFHTCAVLDNNQVKCWGAGGNGRLGYGNTDNLGDDSGEMGDNLSAIDLGAGRTALSVFASELATCALLDNNQMKCWGEGAYGTLGQGNTDDLGDGASEMGDDLNEVDL